VKRARVIVSGRVQGVFFRTSCAEEARRREVAGWVRNSRDGRVEAAFEGLEADVDALVSWCRHGPRGANVEGIEVVAEPVTGENGFRIVG
jgi:acylphosphatase